MLPLGVSSANMSPECMWTDRSFPPGVTPAYSVTALWVIWICDVLLTVLDLVFQNASKANLITFKKNIIGPALV